MRKGEPRLTETNYVVGTPGYFAPEQMMGAEPDFPADLFAVGLVALYLLQGQKPDSKALVEYFTAHGTPGAPQGIPEPLWQVLAGLLQPDPDARFRTATGARKALTTAAEMLPEETEDDEPVEVFDQLGPLPHPFGPEGPVAAPGSGRHALKTPSYGNEPTGEVTGVTGGVTGGATGGPAVGTTGGTTGGTTDGPTDGVTGGQPRSAPQTSMSETGSFHLPPPPQPDRQQPPQQQPQPYQPLPGRTRCSRPRPPLPTPRPRPRIRSRPLPPPRPICRRRRPLRCRTTCRTPVDTPLSGPGFPSSTPRLRTPPPLPPPARSTTRRPSPSRTNDGRDRHPR